MVVGGGEGITLNLHKITPDIKRESWVARFQKRQNNTRFIKRGKITPDIKRESWVARFQKRGKITPDISREVKFHQISRERESELGCRISRETK